MKRLILIAFSFFIIIGTGFLLVSRPAQTPQKRMTKEDETTKILVELGKAVGFTSEIRDYTYADWEEENNTLPLRGKNVFIGTSDLTLSKYPSITPDNLQSISRKNLEPIIAAISNYFLSHGFSKNNKTTRTETVGMTTTYLGFAKDRIKCVVKLDRKTDPFGNITCGKIDTAQAKLQQEFTSLFSGPAAYDGTISSFRIEKTEQTYALGSANAQFSGYMWIARKTNGRWKIVWTGQEAPQCSVMEKYDVPKTIYTSCFNGKTLQ